ncbi:MAG: hypothetical protein QXR35_04245, partial [Candidatus Korarchaeum sp.]
MSKEVTVYRSFIIPFEGKYVMEVTSGDRRFWEGLIKVDLRKFLMDSLDIVNRSGEDMDRAERLELVADLITFFFRAPLTSDPLLSLAPSPPKLYLTLRLRKRFLGKFYEKPIDYLKPLVESAGPDPLIDEELREKIRRAWLVFPADTRPGANTSSLVAHLLTTSSIAWSLAYNSTKDRERLAILRISAQLHDIAKPIEPRAHYRIEVFGDLVRSLLGGILNEEEVNEVVKMVKTHHLDEEGAVRRADHISAETDRIKEIVRSIIGEEFNSAEFRAIASSSQRDVFELAYGGGKDSWDFWETVEKVMPGKIKELSVKFVERLSDAPEIQSEPKPRDDLNYFLIDVGGVQEYVYRSPKLRAVAAASLFIDYLTSFILPLYIQVWFMENEKIFVPLETFLLTSGANVAGILPARVNEETLRKIIEELCKKLGHLKVKLRIAVTPLYQYYPHTWNEVNKAMALEKIVPRVFKNGPDVSKGVDPTRLCALCYREEVIDKKDLCGTCEKLVELSSVLGSRARWDKGFILGQEKIVPNIVWNVEYGEEDDPDSVASNIMELISGMDPPFKERKLNVGIIKGDGNKMGDFFSKSLSISDALERSFRVDQSLKTAYERALRAIFSASDADENARRRDVCRVWLGTIYMGGDDFLIIAPSWLSLPFSYILGKEFEASLGGRCTLSIGVAAVPPKHSVWHGIRAAEEIMKAAKKEVSRRSPASAISFDVVEQGLLSDKVAWRRLIIQRSNGLTARPMKIEGVSGFNMRDLLSFFGYPLDYYNPSMIMTYAYNHRPTQDGRDSPV